MNFDGILANICLNHLCKEQRFPLLFFFLTTTMNKKSVLMLLDARNPISKYLYTNTQLPYSGNFSQGSSLLTAPNTFQ